MKIALYGLFAIFAIAIGLYPIIYFMPEMPSGLLNSKPPALLADTLWNIGFYTHISLGGLALLVGWIQFSKKMRTRYINAHRRIGMIYIISVVLSGTAAIYIGFFATGGLIASIGFISLGIVWLTFTLMAFFRIREKKVYEHQRMMIYSYAACFAAVTLRIWLPLLIMTFQDFIIAYRIVAWLCWVPNLMVAYYFVERGGSLRLPTIAR